MSLRAEVDGLDLQEIDGEFYWRICRDDLLDPLRQLALSIAPRPAETRMELDHIVAELNDEQSRSFFRSATPLFDALPRHVGDQLVAGDRIILRPTRMEAYPPGAVRLRIVSRSFTGDRLELALARWGHWYDSQGEPVSADTASVCIDFTLVREPAPPEPGGGELLDSFYIEVTIARPLPPKGLVGRAYDAIVRDQRQWHLKLPGDETIQDKEVAIRTWAIGLLMRESLSFGQALRAFEKWVGYDVVLSQESDRQARNRLLARVPEARSYLRPR